MKKPYQLLEAKMLMSPQTSINIDNYLNKVATVKYGPMTVLLAALRSLYFLHQQHHWISQGQNYYGDHLLFQRLYESIAEEIDATAEKCVGVGDQTTIDLSLQLKLAYKMLSDLQMASMTQGDDAVKRSLSAEYTFLYVCDLVSQTLDSQGLLTTGLDNFIAGLSDTHEGNVYLLKQRNQ